MEFEKTDLLNCKEIEKLITSDFTNEKSEIINKSLSKYCFLHGHDLFVLEKNITYKRIDSDIKYKLLTKVSVLIQQSMMNLTDNEIKMIKLEFKKEYKSIFTNNNIESYYPQLFDSLKKDDICFDVNLCEIHFNNGYMDLNDLKFKKRSVKKHYITEYIKRD
jgi:hypothetical protein